MTSEALDGQLQSC